MVKVKLEVGEYQYHLNCYFTGKSGDINWVENFLMNLIEKAKGKGLRVDLETGLGSVDKFLPQTEDNVSTQPELSVPEDKKSKLVRRKSQ